MENRNLQWNKRVKVPLILIFSVNTNHESVAYRSFSPSKFEARGARKVTTGIASPLSLHSPGVPAHRVPVGGVPPASHLVRRTPRRGAIPGGRARRPPFNARQDAGSSASSPPAGRRYELSRSDRTREPRTGLWQPSVHSDVAF